MKKNHNNTILIACGTGFFGKSIISCFKNENPGLKKIIVLSRNPQKLDNIFNTKSFPFEIEYINQDIREPIKYSEPIDYLIHTGAESSTSVGVSNPILMMDLVLKGTKNILEYAKQQKIKRCHISTEK